MSLKRSVCDDNGEVYAHSATNQNDEEPPMKKKRNMDPLSKNYREAMCMEVSQTETHYLGKRAVGITRQKTVGHHLRAKHAADISHGIATTRTPKYVARTNTIATQSKRSKPIPPLLTNATPQDIAMRRVTIEYFFVAILQTPPESEWKTLRTVSTIMEYARIPVASTECVKTQLRHILEEKNSGSKCIEKRGRKCLIKLDSAHAQIIYRSLSIGMSTREVTFLVNEQRLYAKMTAVSLSTIQAFIQRSDIIHRSKRLSIKSGNKDENSPWAKARFRQCLQLEFQFQYGNSLDEGIPFVVPPEYKDTPPMYIDGIVWWDEHHRKVILGHMAKTENRIAMVDGVPTSPQDGGTFAEKSPNTVPKYSDEARGLFGVALVNDEGKRAEPYNYTGRTVVGMKRFEEERQKELARVLPLKGQWGAVGAGYKERYAEAGEWEVKLNEVVNSKYCSIKELIDHMIHESKKLYEGTKYEKTFFIFHDALSAYFEKSAQDYIKGIGFKDRMFRCYGDTNKAIRRYQNKLVGNSPELCPLDAHLFSDYKRSITTHCSLTSLYATDDPSRFLFGTPKQAWSSITRVWTVVPTADRIKQDILAITERIRKLIDYKGALCPDEEFRGLRNGRRYQAMLTDKELKNKPRAASRKETLVFQNIPIHPDCIRAKEMLIDPGAVAAAERAYAEAIIDMTNAGEPEPLLQVSEVVVCSVTSTIIEQDEDETEEEENGNNDSEAEAIED